MPSSSAVVLRAAVMLGVLIVLPAYALLGTSLPDKLLPMLEHLAERNEQPPDGDPQPSLFPAQRGSATYAPAAPARPTGVGVDRPAELSDVRYPNHPVSWEEAAAGSAARRQSPPGAATVRVSDDGRRVLSADGFGQLERALWEAGMTRFTVSVENTGRRPSYWCSCQVVDRRERFEAVASDALGAMESVLRQIHAWRSAAAPPRR